MLDDNYNNAEIVSCLLEEPYNVPATLVNASGRSCLELASRTDQFDVCEVLIRRGQAPLTAHALEHYGADLDRDGENAEDHPPLSEETKDERRAALLLLLLPEPLRRAEELTWFRHAANWRRRRSLMMFLAEGGHRPLSHRLTAGQTDPPAAMDRRTSLTSDIFSEEKGVGRHIMAML